MRSRAGEIGAKMSIDSTPGHGTAVCVQLPIPAPDAER